jgi:DNA-binding PadR family transcriptional regulator
MAISKRARALELAVLGLLHDAPMHGYELRKQLIAVLGWGRVLSYGTLYPALKSLVRSGYIVGGEDQTSPVLARRNRIVYRLTADGKEHFAQAMEESGPAAWDDETFGVRFAFFARTDSPTRVRILEGRRSRLEEHLDHARTAALRGRQRADAYTLELQRHGLESVERDVKWLTELIDKERSGGYSDSPEAGSTDIDNADQKATKK